MRGRDGLHMFKNGSFGGNWIEIGSPHRILSDSHGWSDAARYSTIRFGALRAGIKRLDLVARSYDGIHTYRWEQRLSTWIELVPAHTSQRPFADTSEMTDWTRPQYYTTIQLADVDGDGISELVARGASGLLTYRWNEEQHAWSKASGPSVLDGAGFEDESSYSTIQTADLHGNGKQELIVRAPGGVQTLEWSGGDWHVLDASNLFSDQTGSTSPRYFNTIQVGSDTTTGNRWLIGLTAGSQGGSTGAIALSRWHDGSSPGWGQPVVINLPGGGWDQESQYLTLRAADLDGDGKVEVMARAPDGLHVFTRQGRDQEWKELSTLAALSDANGFALRSTYFTIRPLRINLNGTPTDAIVARSPTGVDTYILRNARWLPVRQTYQHFPPWANTDQAAIYVAISQKVESTSDIRSIYDDLDKESHWYGDYQQIKALTCSGTAAYCADFAVVQTQLANEALYVNDLYSFFKTNVGLLGPGSSGYLGQASANIQQVVSTLSISASNTFSLNLFSMITSMIGDIVGAVAGPAGAAIEVASSILSEASSLTDPGPPNFNVAVSQLFNTLEQQQSNAIGVNACYQTDYLTDWSLMEPVGSGIQNNTIMWTPTEQAVATTAANKSLHLFVWKNLAPTGMSFSSIVGTGSGPGITGCDDQNNWNPYCLVWDRWLYHGVMIRWNIGALVSGNSVNHTALDELTGSGGLSDPVHFGQNYTSMVYGKDGWDFSGTPSCYLQSCPDYSSRTPCGPGCGIVTDLGPQVPHESIEQALDATEALYRELDSEQHQPADQRDFLVPLAAAVEKLQKAAQSGKTSQVTSADEFIQLFILRVRNSTASLRGESGAGSRLGQAYRTRSLLVLPQISTADLSPDR